jgi:uncharacterized protein (TIGR00255 family)
MLSSMTGYGRGISRNENLEVTAEVRSVNNRFLDVVIKMPKSLSNYEQKIREQIARSISRGRLNVWITFTGGEVQFRNLTVNKPLLAAYTRLAKEIQKEFDVQGSLDINRLFELQDVFVQNGTDSADEETWMLVREALDEALVQLSDMRGREGVELKKDIAARIAHLSKTVTDIERLAKGRPVEELDKLRSRIQPLMKNEIVDAGRFEMELAIIADRIDISEECVRFHCHNKLFSELLESQESSGRRLNFLLQEMNREANTIGSKAASSEISHLVVEIKEEIERIREQIQNVE